MPNNFPKPIVDLGEVALPFEGAKGYLSQGGEHQILFMAFDEDIELPEHSHESQWAVVLEGKIELKIDGVINVYHKGDRYFIPSGIKHSGKIYAGYSDITFFNEKNRYKRK